MSGFRIWNNLFDANVLAGFSVAFLCCECGLNLLDNIFVFVHAVPFSLSHLILKSNHALVFSAETHAF